MSSGNENASVFPDPVKAIPIMSRPEKLKAREISQCGARARTVDVRDGKTLQLNRRRSHDLFRFQIIQQRSRKLHVLLRDESATVPFIVEERRRTRKSGIGGGTSSPETRIWNFSRILSFSASVRLRMYVGAVHLSRATERQSPVRDCEKDGCRTSWGEVYRRRFLWQRLLRTGASFVRLIERRE